VNSAAGTLWKTSVKGRAYMALKQAGTVPLINGKKFYGGLKKGFRLNEANNALIPDGTARCAGTGSACQPNLCMSIIANDDFTYDCEIYRDGSAQAARVLVDTGAAAGNFISSQLVKNVIKLGFSLEPSSLSICSCHGHCNNCASAVKLNLRISTANKSIWELEGIICHELPG
jgi:hypothetical protein